MRVELSKKILLWRTSKSESPYVCNCKSGFNGHRCERISSSNYYSNDISAQPISAFVPAFSNGLQRPNSLSASQVKVTKSYKVNCPFNLHPEKWFEGYPVKSTHIFSRSSPDFFLIYILSFCASLFNWPSKAKFTVSIGGKQRRQNLGSYIHFRPIFTKWFCDFVAFKNIKNMVIVKDNFSPQSQNCILKIF